MSKDVIRCLMITYGFSRKNAELALVWEREGNLCRDEEDFLNRVKLNPRKEWVDYRTANQFNFRLTMNGGAAKTGYDGYVRKRY